MALDILNNRKDVSTINDTHYFLVPKVKTPTQVKEFRSLVSVMSCISWFLKSLLIGCVLLCCLSSMIVKVLLFKIDLLWIT